MRALLALLLLAIPAAAQFTNAHSIWSRPITNAAPSDGNAITWSAAQGKFVFSASGGGTAPYSCTVTATAGPLACTHNLGTATPWVSCYDGSGNMLGSTGASTSIVSVVATTTNIATITFSGATTGTCLISTGSMGPAGATGAQGAAGSGSTITVTNDGSTGTSTNLLAKITTSGTAVTIGTSDTAIPVFVCASGCGTTSSATLIGVGTATCQSDASGVTQGHFIQASATTAGRCHDAGTTAPTSGWVIGIAQTTAAANGTFPLIMATGYNASAASTSLIGVMTYKASNWTATGAALAMFSADTIDADSSGGTIWAIGQPTRFVAPTSGRYQARCGLYSDGSAGVTFAVRFQLNGATSDAASYTGLITGVTGGASNNPFQSNEAFRVFNLTAGDYVECQYYVTNTITMTGGKNKGFMVFNKEAW